jgi:Conserved TM helix
MDTLEEIWDAIRDAVPGYVVGAVVVLVVGWLVAWLLSKVVAGVLRRAGVGRRLARFVDGGEADASGAAGRVVFYLIMLFVVIAVLDRLQLRLATAPLTDLLSRVFAFIPNLLGAALLALVAWILATILRTVVFQLSRTARLDERLGAAAAGETERAAGPPPSPQAVAARPAGAEGFPLARALSEVAYALVFLLFLPAILDALGLGGLLEPVNELLNTVLGFIPNLVAAALILLIGWFIARFVSRLVAGLLAAIGTDRLSERIGLAATLGGQRLSNLLGLVVYALILIPVIIAALNALQLPAVTQPASEMLDTLLATIPRVLAAAAILVIGYAVGRVVSELVANVLTGAGFDRLPARLGLAAAAEGAAAPGGGTPSRLAGALVLAAFMWFAVIEALEVLGLEALTGLLAALLVVAGRILLGLLIIAVGLWLARLAARAIRGSGVEQPNLLAFAAQAAVLVLFGAMGLRQMGVANSIINLAFAILLGAIGVAVAIAFGVGGRDTAGRLLDRWVGQARTGELDRAARQAIEGGPAAESGAPTA